MDINPLKTEITYRAPYGGWNTTEPENIIGKEFTPFVEGFEFRNKELRTCPRLKNVMPHPPDGPVRGLTSFADSNNVVHTIAITANNIWQLNFRSDGSWIWNQVGSFNTNGIDQQHAVQVFLDKVYWTTGTPGLFYWDGITQTLSEATAVGGVAQYGAYYLGTLGFHLILLNTVEATGGNFPQRVRWSPSGLPTVWNPATNSAAGYNDMLDVPDTITGFMTVGKAGFIFRVNGISQMVLTGQASKPFQFDHLWASDRGIGNAYAQACASYGPLGIIISTEEIYRVTAADFSPIGKGARDKILCDLARATSAPIATIIPGYHRKMIYLTYRLTIPIGSDCVMWTYGIEDNNWSRRSIELGYPTTRMRWVSIK